MVSLNTVGVCFPVDEYDLTDDSYSTGNGWKATSLSGFNRARRNLDASRVVEENSPGVDRGFLI
jgi:hypothetical protein